MEQEANTEAASPHPDADDVEVFLRSGAVVVVHLDPSEKHGLRCRSFVRSWEKKSHIVLDRPKTRGRLAPLTEGQPCVVRFVSDANACAFESRVLSWSDDKQEAHCSISWPEQLRNVPFRRYYRIKVDLPCKFAMNGGIYHGTIRDLSMGGCGIAVPDASVVPGAFLELAFTLPDGLSLENVQAIVRDARPQGNGIFLGCEFSDRQEHVQSDIAYSVSVTFERERGQKPPSPYVLIMDEDDIAANALGTELRRRGWEVFTAIGIVDGLQRLRAIPPGALILNQDHRELTGLETVRLVKLTRGFELLPIFLYGGDDPGLGEKALQSGVTEYFPPPFNALAICDRVCATAGAKKQ